MKCEVQSRDASSWREGAEDGQRVTAGNPGLRTRSRRELDQRFSDSGPVAARGSKVPLAGRGTGHFWG